MDHTRFNKSELYLFSATAALVLLFLLPVSTAATTPRYTVIDLGTLPGGNISLAQGINEAGQVVGGASTSLSGDHAFLWEKGVMSDLGTHADKPRSRALQINNATQVVGYSYSLGTMAAFLWENGQMIDLGSFGGDFTEAYGINNLGQVVGGSLTSDGFGRAFLWENGVIHDLGFGDGSRATAINDRSQVVGNSSHPDCHGNACLWEEGVMHDLGGPGNPFSLNDLGRVVGQAFIGEYLHAVMWEQGSRTDLGTLPGFLRSIATDVNNRGQIVGYSWTTTESDSRAFLWEDGAMIDVNSLLPAESGWVLQRAAGINEAGAIVGSGLIDGDSRAFLMIPAIGGSVTGVKPIAVACRNLTHKQTTFPTIPTGDTSWNCSDAGLEVKPGDIVIQTILGRVE